ncbi:unnamed protein product [Nippostrongylus brasiliensis]|uniref:DDE-1 domain-containing protein n=1 Tax=Nippostrongylus brasiliensis TaxID=27835 RepID=A0A158R3L0_NIPBR|nr:unnamed protein product [Nippostrongylus brasiliensis]
MQTSRSDSIGRRNGTVCIITGDRLGTIEEEATYWLEHCKPLTGEQSVKERPTPKKSATFHNVIDLQEICVAEDFPCFNPPPATVFPVTISLGRRLLWAVLEKKVCSTKPSSLDFLKADLVKAWDELGSDHLRRTVDAFPKDLRSCDRQK